MFFLGAGVFMRVARDVPGAPDALHPRMR